MARKRRARGTHRCKGRDATGRILPGWALDRKSGKLYRTRPAAAAPSRPAPKRAAPKRNGPGKRKPPAPSIDIRATRAFRRLARVPGEQLDMF